MRFLQKISGIGEIEYYNSPQLFGVDEEILDGQNLYYPSSGRDINDLLYLNPKRISAIQNLEPKVFIHSDYIIDNISEIENRLCYNFCIKDSIKINYFFKRNNYDYLLIYKLQNLHTQEVKWLILVSGCFNEEILKIFIQCKIQIPIIYSVCDGITSGMGCINSNSISTLLYPFFKNVLNIKVIVTDQLVDNTLPYYIDILEKGLIIIKNLRNLIGDLKINEPDFHDSELIKIINNIYNDFTLIYLNRESLNCFSNGSLNLYLFKR